MSTNLILICESLPKARKSQVTRPLTAAISFGILTLAMAPWHANASSHWCYSLACQVRIRAAI